MTIKELREKLTKAAQRIKKLSDEFNERQKKVKDGEDGAELWPGETRQEWRDANKEYDELKAKYEEAEEEARMVARAAEVGDWLERSSAEPNNRPDPDDQIPGTDGTTYRDAGAQNRDQAQAFEQRERDLTLCFQAWSARGVPTVQLREEHREACQRMQFDPTAMDLHLRMLDTSNFQLLQRRMNAVHPAQRERVFDEVLEQRALSSGLGSAGGYVTAPASVMRAIELASIEFGAMLQVAETITTETGEDMSWPYADDTSNEAKYTYENVSNQSDTDPTFEAVVWRAHDLHSDFIKVPYKLFRDSFLNIGVLIGRMIGERFGRKISGEATTGTDKIRGVIPRAHVGQTSAGATAITYADVVGLEHSLDPSLRARAGHMFHDVVLEALRLLLDDQSRPLWISNIAAGIPDTFNGRRYTINQKMASTIEASAKTMAFGDFSSYKLRRVGPSLRLRRLVERYAEYDQTAFIGYMSCDGNLLRPNSDDACPVKVLQQTT